jgi:hypothetical protein
MKDFQGSTGLARILAIKSSINDKAKRRAKAMGKITSMKNSQ